MMVSFPDSFLKNHYFFSRSDGGTGNINREVEIKFETKSVLWNLIRTDFSANSSLLKPNQMTNPKRAVRAEQGLVCEPRGLP